MLAGLRDRMVAMLRDEQDPRALGNGAVFETYKYTAGRGKGYDTWLKAQNAATSDLMKRGGEAAPAKAKRANRKAAAKADER